MPDPRLFDQDQPDTPVTRRGSNDAPQRRVDASRSVAVDDRPSPSRDRADVLDDADVLEDADRYVRIPEPSGPVRRALYVTLAFVGVVALMVAGATVWIQRQINPPGGPGEAQTLIVPGGSTTDDIVNQLADEGIVSNPTVFRYYLRWRGEGPFQAGEYTLVANSSFDDVISTLASGPAPERFERFTVPEGLTLDEISDRLDAQIEGFDADEMQSALIRMESRWRPDDIDSWEGLLFPDTYEYRATEDTLSVLQRMNRQFDAVADEVLGDPLVNLDPFTLQYNGPSAYEYIVIASMIEKEARLPEEHALMSRVIHNRIALGMTLGIDATVLYARGPERTGPITDADLAIDSPYNTRLNPGLPPTPIAVPSRSALEAARHPADGPWLYYVLADEDGSHFFTDDYDEFLRVRDESRAAGIF